MSGNSSGIDRQSEHASVSSCSNRFATGRDGGSESKHEVDEEQEEATDKEAIGTPALCETAPVGKQAWFKLEKAKLYKGDGVQYWDKDLKEWLLGTVLHGNDESVQILVVEHPQVGMLATCFNMPQGHKDLWKIANPRGVSGK